VSIFAFLNARKKSVDLTPYMRRICDLTVPNRCVTADQARAEDRYNRTLPVLLCPWAEGRPIVRGAQFAITKDLSDRGISVTTTAPIEGEFVVAFARLEEGSEPWFFIGKARRSSAIGGGFWTTGVELSEFVTTNYRHVLQALGPLVNRLSPEPS
jgi:hypothetical protein